MYKHGALFIVMLFFALCFHMRGYAQQYAADTAQLHTVTTNMADAFYKAVGERARLYNGPAVEPYDFVATATNANFKDTAAFINGNVKYDGIAYTNVPLLYNIDRDLLMARMYNQFAQFDLLSNRVADFDLMGHHFVRLYADSLNKLSQTGFYDELYAKKLQVFARRTKSIQQEAVSRGINRYFLPKTTYYLKKGAYYYSVNSQGAFLDVLKDKKKELKQYLKDNKIRFRDDPEYAMAMIAAYYDHLTN